MKAAFNIVLLCVFLILLILGSSIELGGVESTQKNVIDCQITQTEKDNSVTAIQYTSFNVPPINTSFKSYMDYRAITDKNSPQYKFVQQWAWVDDEGFMRCSGEKDLGIEDDYYLIALGSYYGTKIGTKYRITLNTGRVFYGVLSDCKNNIHTNSTNQYVPHNNNIVEFIVDTTRLNGSVKYHGSANVHMPLNGSVSKIERIDFMEDNN